MAWCRRLRTLRTGCRRVACDLNSSSSWAAGRAHGPTRRSIERRLAQRPVNRQLAVLVAVRRCMRRQHVHGGHCDERSSHHRVTSDGIALARAHRRARAARLRRARAPIQARLVRVCSRESAGGWAERGRLTRAAIRSPRSLELQLGLLPCTCCVRRVCERGANAVGGSWPAGSWLRCLGPRTRAIAAERRAARVSSRGARRRWRPERRRADGCRARTAIRTRSAHAHAADRAATAATRATERASAQRGEFPTSSASIARLCAQPKRMHVLGVLLRRGCRARR